VNCYDQSYLLAITLRKWYIENNMSLEHDWNQLKMATQTQEVSLVAADYGKPPEFVLGTLDGPNMRFSEPHRDPDQEGLMVMDWATYNGNTPYLINDIVGNKQNEAPANILQLFLNKVYGELRIPTPRFFWNAKYPDLLLLGNRDSGLLLKIGSIDPNTGYLKGTAIFVQQRPL